MAKRKKSLGERWDHMRDILEFQIRVPEGDPEAAQKIRLKNRRRAFAAKIVYALVIVAAIAALARYFVSHRVYTSYETVSSRNVADNISNYRLVNGKLLRYSQDGLSLLDTELNALWNRAYDLAQPVAVTAKEAIAVYDRRGTRIVVFNSAGEVGGFGTELPIIAARVSGAGNVVAALENGDYTKLVYYTAGGEVIAELAEDAAREDQIAAFAVSENGETIAVAYFESFGSTVGTRLVFYNFGTAGQEKEDHIVDERNYQGELLPYLTYYNGGFVAVRDSGFSVFRGGEPVDTFFLENILSVVEGDGCIGFVFASRDVDHRYRMELYSANGRLRSSFPVDIAYDRISISEGSVVFSNGTDLAVYTLDGFKSFDGKVEEGTIFDILKIGQNRYFLVTDMKAGLIRLK